MLFRSEFLLSLTIVALSLCFPARAQDTAEIDQVLATVNGTEITLGNVLALRASLPPHYDQLPPETLYQGILDQLVQQTLLMQSLDGKTSKRSTLAIENESRAIVASEVISAFLARELSEDRIQTAYDQRYPADNAGTEYNASHILLETEEDANQIRQKIADGADFAEMAREHSTGPSGPAGGSLGWFGPGVMVEPFFNAVLTLEPEQVSSPVQTQFGWHLILLNEIRATERPKLEDVRAEIAEELRQGDFEAYVKELEAQATVTRVDPAQVDATIVNQIELLEE